MPPFSDPRDLPLKSFSTFLGHRRSRQVVERPLLRLPRPPVTHFQLQTPPEVAEEGTVMGAAVCCGVPSGMTNSLLLKMAMYTVGFTH